MPRKKVLPNLLPITSHQTSHQKLRWRWGIWVLAGVSLVLAMARIRLDSPTPMASSTDVPGHFFQNIGFPADSMHTFLGTALLTSLAIFSTWTVYRTLIDPPNEFERINHRHFLQILLGSILFFLIIVSTLSATMEQQGNLQFFLFSHQFLILGNIELISALLIGNVITLLLGKKSATLFFLISSMILSLIPTTPFGVAILPMLAGPISSSLGISLPGRLGSLKTGLATGFGVAILFSAVDLITGRANLITLRTEAWAALATTLLFPMVGNVAMPLLERSLNLLSEASLTELLDLNHPLLQEFSKKAPGSFFHSLAVAQIAEAAALAIGANTKLARVSAYFHDVGKIDKPQYFIENQTSFNRHELLTPRMSSLILIDHVRKGIEIAKKYSLPETIVDAIPEHHGTRIMQYFLRKSREGSASQLDSPNESDFRYPGPKPQSKITAIIMMADAIEATGRAVKAQDASSARIISVIDETLSEIQRDGQLDECPLTISDIAILREVFIRTLLQTQHKRIAYPGGQPSSAPSALNPTNAR